MCSCLIGLVFDCLPFDQAWMSELDRFKSNIALGIRCLGRIAILSNRRHERLQVELTYRKQQSRR